MAHTTPPNIDAPPPAPQRGNRATFSGLVDAFVTWLIAAVAQFGAVATNCYNNAVDCYNNADSAAASALTASAGAAAAVVAANAALWVSGATVAQWACVISPANGRTYRRTAASGSGATDPSADTTNYVLISNFGYFQSADQTITAAGALTIAHGLGRAPTLLQAFLKNTSTESGYAVNDVVSTPIGPTYDGGLGHGVAVTADATNIYVRFSSTTSTFLIVNKTSGDNGGFTNSKWSFFVRVLA